MQGEEIKTVVAMSDKSRNECILNLRKLLSADEKLNLLQSDDSYLERYLYSTNFNVGKAFKKMKLFYDLLEESPEWFSTGSPRDKKNIIEKDIRMLTPIYDKEGRRVYIVKIGNMSSKTMDLLSDVVVVDDFFMEMLLADDNELKNGLSVIVDISNFSWNLIRWLTPGNIKTAIKRIQTMPIKDYRYHVVNSSLPIHAAVNIIWPFLPLQIKEGVKFHFNDWDSLHEHIDPSVLPPEYGGTNIIDYKKYHHEVFEKNDQILSSFKINRVMYLQKIEEREED